MTTCEAPRRREGVCEGEPWPALCAEWTCLYWCNSETDQWDDGYPFADNVCRSAP